MLGLWNTRSRQCFLAPAEDRVVTADDALIIMRDTATAREDYAPSNEPADVDIGGSRCCSCAACAGSAAACVRV